MSKLGIGERIKKLRETNHLTQAELSRNLSITHQSISKWEREESVPDTMMIIELSKVFSVPTDYLLLGKTSIIEVRNTDEAALLNVKSIGELSHGELLALYSAELVKDMSIDNRKLLQNLGFISIGNTPEWTLEGKQLSDEYWYRCSELILKEIENSSNLDEIYLLINKRIELPKQLLYQFIDNLVSIGKIEHVSSLIMRLKE